MFPDGAMVSMSDGSVLPIDRVEKSDNVERTGEHGRLSAVLRGGFDGQLVLLSVGMQTAPLVCTSGTLVGSILMRSGRMQTGIHAANEIRKGDLLQVHDKDDELKPGTILADGRMFFPVEYVSEIKYKGHINSLFGLRYCVDGFVVS